MKSKSPRGARRSRLLPRTPKGPESRGFPLNSEPFFSARSRGLEPLTSGVTVVTEGAVHRNTDPHAVGKSITYGDGWSPILHGDTPNLRGFSTRFLPASLEVGRTGAPEVGGLDEQQPLLTVAEVAKRLGVAKSTVYVLCARGELGHVRVLNAIRVPESALARFGSSSK